MTATQQPQPPARIPRDGEAGFGLVEILISMFLLLLLAVSFLPLLIVSLKATASNSTAATATQVAAQQLQEARNRAATCQALIAYTTEGVPAVESPHGGQLQPVRTPLSSADCPATYPGTVLVTVEVRSGGGDVLASAKTRILVTKAG